MGAGTLDVCLKGVWTCFPSSFKSVLFAFKVDYCRTTIAEKQEQACGEALMSTILQ